MILFHPNPPPFSPPRIPAGLRRLFFGVLGVFFCKTVVCFVFFRKKTSFYNFETPAPISKNRKKWLRKVDAVLRLSLRSDLLQVSALGV